MTSARDFLASRICKAIEECGGYINNETNAKVYELADFVAEDPDSETKTEETKHEVTIRWGRDEEAKRETESTYSFETAAELSAFMNGVDAMDGWMEYEIVENENKDEG